MRVVPIKRLHGHHSHYDFGLQASILLRNMIDTLDSLGYRC